MLQARFPVVLASASPRRRELLSRLFASFEVLEPDINEEIMRTEDPWQTALATARAKAVWAFKQRPEATIISGDTVVAVEGSTGGKWIQLGKPKDQLEAVQMLETLSGQRHAVISAVAVHSPEGKLEFEDTSWVTFRPIARREIEAYVASGEPMDKAGGYAIQGGAKGFVAGVEGDISTVIGLPVERLEAELLERELAATY